MFFDQIAFSISWCDFPRNFTGNGLPKMALQFLIVSFQMTSLKLSILLLRFYFHVVLEPLKTNFHRNFLFKRVLGFVTLEFRSFCVERHLYDGRESCRLSCRLKKRLISANLALNSTTGIRKSITLMFISSSRNNFTLL